MVNNMEEHKGNSKKVKLDPDVKLMFITFKVILLIGCLIVAFSAISGLFVFVKGTSVNDINYNFATSTYYNSSFLTYNDSFNIRERPDGLSEVDKWEFALDSPDVLNSVGADDPNGWTDYEETTDNVNIMAHSTNDRQIHLDGAGGDNGLSRSNFDGITFRQDDDNVNISIEFRYVGVNNSVKTNLYIYSSDNTLVAQIRWYHRGYPHFIFRLEQYDGGAYQVLDGNMQQLGITTFIDYNIGIDYTTETVNLRFSNATDDFYYSFATITSGKAGVKTISFQNTDGDGDTFPFISMNIRLNSIGYYSNGYSQSDEYAWKSIQLPVNWNIENHNLITSTYLGWGMVNYTDGVYEVGSTTLEDFTEFSWYTNVSERINIYHTYVAVITDPYLIFYQVNQFFDYVWWWEQSFDVISFYIQGATLVEPSRTTFLDYTYSEGYTDPEDNYFYVGNNTNDLYFTLTCTNSYVEWIQADFDISNKLSNDFALKFEVDIEAGVHDLYGAGAFYLNFDGDTSWGYTFDGLDKFNQIIPQGKTILTMTILITDNDEDWQSGTTITGYITNFQFLYFPNIGTSLLISDMLTMLVPLIVLIAPTLGFAKKFGKKVIVPVLMLMSIVCVATDLIPYWIFFVMIFSFIVFMFFSYKSDKGVFG